MTEPFVAMTDSYSPLVSAAQLGVYLDDDDIDTARADMLIEQAQVLCQSIVTPLPSSASVVVIRVAGRAYVTITKSRSVDNPIGIQSPFGASPGGSGAVFLSRSDKADLRRLNAVAGNTGGGAFSINMLPAGYTAALRTWDINSGTDGVSIA